MEESSLKEQAQVTRQQYELEANRLAQQAGRALPFPSVWDTLDPTKLPEGASPEEIALRYKRFCKLCPPPVKIEYTI